MTDEVTQLTSLKVQKTGNYVIFIWSLDQMFVLSNKWYLFAMPFKYIFNSIFNVKANDYQNNAFTYH